MKAEITWLDDPEVFRLGQIPVHSDHQFYPNYSEMKRGDSSLISSLNGTWKFSFADTPMERPQEFYQVGYDTTDFDDIKVPSHIELNGYGQIQYINTLYPWEGKFFRRPAYVPDESDPQMGMFSEGLDNTVGAYVKEFKIPDNFKDHRISVEFGGVERAMYLWINGHFLGYCEDSFAPSEYDLTPYLDEAGINTIAVEVFKHSTASFIEDQDMFRFSGIFRDVNLVARPKIHVEDLTIRPTLADDFKTGQLEVVTKLTGSEIAGAIVKLVAVDGDGNTIFEHQQPASEQIEFDSPALANVHLWDNLDPYLYSLTIEIRDHAGNLVEVVPYDFGFRKIEIKDKVILLNGERLKLNGVNRHEWSAESGRVISMAEMQADMTTIKQNNINAVRTCHYMDQIPWYYMCDQNGIYMMAENNLESHGSWQKMGAVEPSYNVPGSSPHWLHAVLNRAQNNYETFKNHTSILFWSLGMNRMLAMTSQQ
ncbi:beta-galactosidase large subunit [Lentilactobacillus kosonis]|uniref:beta-galactosidase n=1 Tax=Lentilactobacillus kosonis TaxID=2810561 RepID=A0A401FIS1_9LACO|nr:beta-galactosidase large subunit [Lentilactobacillus kosonis]